MSDGPLQITISYDPVRLSGVLETPGSDQSTVWDRIRAKVFADQSVIASSETRIEIPWTDTLALLRDFGSKAQQRTLNFRFVPNGEAAERIRNFAEEVRAARAARDTLTLQVSEAEITERLVALGFTKRKLTPFQVRDLRHLLSLPHGANFSVPGAGKTTVTFALHLLTQVAGQHLLVVCPRSALSAWKNVIQECLGENASVDVQEPFVTLDESSEGNDERLRSGSTRFLMSYDLMVRQADMLSSYFSRQAVHLVLDEAHRMKAGIASQRGAFLLNVAPLPARRDILTGTPMPQGPDDLSAQLGFLWPGQGLDLQISRGSPPRDVLGQLYVRTTKSELDIPAADREFYQVDMAEGQMALYGVVRNESLRQLKHSVGRSGGEFDAIRARRSVMRLLQLSTNPVLALQGITESAPGVESGIVDQVLLEGPSQKMRAVEAHARRLAQAGRKVVIWTIFTDTLQALEQMLVDINPVTLYGAVPSGDENDPATREGRIRRFHVDPACMAVIANPAAVGEGISLHTVCHEAIYLDRSYVATHYLQSIDRIHRLGLPPGTETHVHIYQTKAPLGLGSIDYSVNRRLARKIRGLQQLLNDPDLHQLALDEENAIDPIDYDVGLDDLIDLIEELEGKEISVGGESPDGGI
jgi:SNF2 family DNA or RNA helicase